MKTFLVAFATMSLVYLAPPAIAAEKYDSAALAREVEPYLDDTTLVVAHVDLTRVDVRPMVARIKQSFAKITAAPPDATAALDKGADAIQQWIADFTKAGGHDCYAVVSMSGFPEFPVVIVVPFGPGADGPAIAKLIGTNVSDPTVGTPEQVRGQAHGEGG